MKKAISLILVMVNILSFSAFAQDMSEQQKSELYTLGIMTGDETGNLRLGDSITRAEAVKMICVAGNLKTDNVTEEAFPDVSQEHWAYKYICSAKQNKIISGDEKGNFNPDACVTNEEMIKMIVCLLGYGEYAQGLGGYPAGFRAAAAELKITEGMKLLVNTAASRNDAGIMLCNALDVPLMVSEKQDGDIIYTVMDGKNGTALKTLRNM